MAEGTIKTLTDRGFGFIDTGKDKDLFFRVRPPNPILQGLLNFGGLSNAAGSRGER
jgi:hypothetical protein